MKTLIKTQNLSKNFMGVKAVDGLTINIPEGKATGLIGPNGSGKSTLMNLLTGMISPENGSMSIHDKAYEKVKSYELRNLKIARTFQDGRLVEQLNVDDNLLLSVADNNWKNLFSSKKDAYAKKLNEVLEIVGLTEHRLKKAEALSYGQRKLLEVGRVLIQDADVYFFDEPFTGLFPQVVERVLNILKGLKAQGKTIVIIEHNMGLIQEICDYAIVLDHGKLLAEGTPKTVLKNKKVQEAYLGV
ncbi:MAG: ATP-binding cassette domain-containing protein [Alphaproteobacteria bacterium]